MITECTQRTLAFHGCGGRDIVARFDGGRVTSDGGGLLLREVEDRFGFIRKFAACFTDHRDSQLIEHSLVDRLTVQELRDLLEFLESLK